MAYESKSFKEHHFTRLPVLEKLLSLGWEREQIICPSPESDDTEWHVPKTPSEAASREAKRSFKGYPVDIALFDDVEFVNDYEHIVAIIVNYYKIVCVQEIVFTATSFIEAFSDLKDIIQIKRYLNELMNMTEMLLVQTYLYTTVDLSYCRLAKHEDMIYYFAKRDMYEKVYDAIINSTKLSDIEKSDLIESIRMSIINHTTYSHSQDVEDFKAKQRFHREDRIYNLDIKSEPIALLFIRFIEQNDIDNFIYYRYAWNNSDKKDRSVNFALILAILSVVNNLNNKGKREYLYDIIIEPKTVKKLFKKCELLNIKVDDEALNDYYTFITENYIADKKETEDRKRLYGFHPKLAFDQNVVDMLFSYLYWKNQKEHTIKEMANKHNLTYRKDIEKIILSLCPENKEKSK